MTTDELLEKLPSHIDTEWFNLHNDGKNWLASYGTKDEFLCMNPNAVELPYDNAFAYGKTPNEALQGLYDWCGKHKLL